MKRKPRIIVFDVNETLLDLRSLETSFQEVFADTRVLNEWFQQLILYSMTASTLDVYYDFLDLGGSALEMVAATHEIHLTDEQKQTILGQMLKLPPHPDVFEALNELKNAGFRMVTMTNSSLSAVQKQLQNAKLSDFFERNFAVEATGQYKPASGTYRYVAQELSVGVTALRLVATHSWDTMGALRVGASAAFVERPNNRLLPLPANNPDIVGADLKAVARQIIERDAPLQ